MAESTQTSTASSTLTALTKRLDGMETVTDLFKLANSDEFKTAAHSLTPAELKALRDSYRDRQTRLDGKVKLDVFDGQVLQIIDLEYWHSDQYDNDGVTLKFHPETDLSKTYKALTSSAPIVRFANQFDTPPTAANPARVLVALKPVSDPERAAKGQKVWTIKRLSSPQHVGDGSEGLPF